MSTEASQDRFSVRFMGVVRSLAEQEARAAFTGSDLAQEILEERASTRIVVNNEEEAREMINLLYDVEEHNDLGVRQERCLRQIRGDLRDQEAKYRTGHGLQKPE